MLAISNRQPAPRRTLTPISDAEIQEDIQREFGSSSKSQFLQYSRSFEEAEARNFVGFADVLEQELRQLFSDRHET